VAHGGGWGYCGGSGDHSSFIVILSPSGSIALVPPSLAFPCPVRCSLFPVPLPLVVGCWVVRRRCSVITHPPYEQGLAAVGSPGPIPLGHYPSPLSTLRAEARRRGCAVLVPFRCYIDRT
jgi:hypothetical protein